MKILIALGLIVGLGFGAFSVAAAAYRSQHCVYLFGHWLSLERTTISVFCQ